MALISMILISYRTRPSIDLVIWLILSLADAVTHVLVKEYRDSLSKRVIY
jgi:hypothetical protein